MLRAWRIVQARHSRTAFDGEGARTSGGRWNSAGVPMVYLADSRALALLEILVHVGDERLLGSYVLIEVACEERHCMRLGDEALPADWAAIPAPASAQAIGDTWARSGRSALISVPSAIVPPERNLLLNPRHPAVRALRLGDPVRFPIDSRLARGASTRARRS